MNAGEHAEAVRAGGRLVRSVAVAVVASSAVVILALNMTRGEGSASLQLMGFVVIWLVSRSLARGSSAARWAFVVLFTVAGLVLLAAGIRTTSGWLIALGTIYVGAVGVLLFAPSARLFFATSQRHD